MTRKIYPLILLAAGQSRRAGQPKGLIPYQNKTWIEHQLTEFQGCGGEIVYLVLGFNSDQYEKTLPWLSKSRFQNLEIKIIKNENSELGQFSSIQTGLQALKPEDKACFILPVDVPVPHQEVWEKLCHGLNQDIQTIAAVMPTLNGRGGHPILLSYDFAQGLLQLDPRKKQARLDTQIHGLSKSKFKNIEVLDSRILENKNTQEDY